MKVAIIGSRTFNDYFYLCAKLRELSLPITTVISGGAIGADSLARKYAKDYDLELVEYLPEWGKYGKSAGLLRNSDIVFNSDVVIAFWDGKSKGTKHAINKATLLSKPIHVFNYLNDPY